MILSVSRRTDIPAFYSSWFMERLKAGYVLVRNPYNYHQLSQIPLSPENVDCIVFWTKYSAPLHIYLDNIKNMGYNFYFHYTITPYSNDIEVNMKNKKDVVMSFQELSSIIGSEKVILRYDPVLLKSKYTLEYHIKAFNILCSKLKGYTNKVIISFIDDYKTLEYANFKYEKISKNEMENIAEHFSKIAYDNNMVIETCAEEIDLSKYNIHHTKCIDYDLIEKIIQKPLKKYNSKGNMLYDKTRENCQCLKCIDIGEYSTCPHNCLYCYANTSHKLVMKNHKLHNKYSPLLIGELEDNDKIISRSEKDTKSLIVENTILNYL